jgi:hypothetical protein
MTNATTKPNTQTLLARAHDILTQVETVLVHASPATRNEITELLADHADNYGGHGLLTDLVQFTAADIDHHINH